MRNLVLFFTLITFTTLAHAKFEIQTSTGYSSNADGKTNYAFTDMTNHIFLGASFDNKDKYVVGQNISIISNQYKVSTTNKLSTLELGPRLNWYINTDRNFFVAVAWNPYAKGTRTVSSTTEKISGWSYLLAFGAVLKMGGNFYMGASINYHSLSITEAISSSNTASTVSNNYTSLMPMLNISFRFR